MVDDIGFEHCVEGDVPEDYDQLSCDFTEGNICSWYHDHTASMLWKSDLQGEYVQFQFHLILSWIT